MLSKEEIKKLHKLCDSIKDGDMKVRIKFENNSDANDCLRFLKSKGVKSADLIFDTTIEAISSDIDKDLELIIDRKYDVISIQRKQWDSLKAKDDLTSNSDIEVIEDAIYWVKRDGKPLTIKNVFRQIDTDNKGFYNEKKKQDIIEYLKRKYNLKDSLKTFKVNNKIVKAKDEFDAINKYKRMRDNKCKDTTPVNIDAELVYYDKTGKMVHKRISHDKLEKLSIVNGRSTDYSNFNSKAGSGAITPRKELWNQPKLKGFLGPMWNGDCIRYESSKVYEHMSI